jgi:hypothetical protein
MLISKIISNIQSNLGNRAAGTIGTKPTNTAILDAINETLRRLPVVAFPEYAERILKITLDEGKFAYDYPTKDINDVSVRMLDILSHQLYDSEDNRRELIYETGRNFDSIHNYIRTNDSIGTPTHMMRYGKKLYFSPTPDSTYTLYLRSRCTVSDITAEQIGEELFVSDDWVLPLQAYATYLLYTTLQQTALASFWYTVYEDTKKEAEHLRERQVSLQQETNAGYVPREDNPFVKRDFRG